MYADGTSAVHGFLADGSQIAYKLGVGGDDYVGHQLGDGYWVKAKIVGPEPEYVLAMMQGFVYKTERRKVWEMDALTPAHFNKHEGLDNGLVQAVPQPNMSTIEDWLTSISLQDYVQAIKEYGYDSLDALDEALEGDIEEMVNDPSINLKKPHRRLLMKKWQKRVSNKEEGIDGRRNPKNPGS